MKLNENVVSIPTIGFNVEEISPVNGITFTVWDVGGQNKIRPLWRKYFENTEGLIFVVDSTDTERLSEAKDELHSILKDINMCNVPVVVLANKQDLPNALSASEVYENFDLKSLRNKWHIQGTNATKGEGLLEAMKMLAKYVKEYQTRNN